MITTYFKQKQVKVVILFMLFFSFLMNYSPIYSYACSCAEPRPVEEALKDSAFVFSGKVVKIVDKKKNNLIQSSADSIAIIFEVNKSWKGLNQKQVIIYTERSSASCGYEFVLNKEYLVYGYKENGDFRVSLCSRTSPLPQAANDIEKLGEGKDPTEQGTKFTEVKQFNDQIPSETSSINPYYILLLIVGGLVVIAYFLRRNKK